MNFLNLTHERFVKSQNLQTASSGSHADVRAGVDIEQVQGGYFSARKNVEAFLELGLGPVEKDLPEDVNYADLGGGSGVLAISVTDYLEAKGHKVRPVVVDGNPMFLEKAKERGLRTQLCDLETCDLEGLNLVTMRAVNHYNTVDKQQEILDNVYRSLGENGYLVSQISSGSAANCELRSNLSNLESLGRAIGNDQYHWLPRQEFIRLLENSGFSKNSFVGCAPSNCYGPGEQWERFNKKRTQEAAAQRNEQELGRIQEQKKLFLQDAEDLIRACYEKCGKEISGVHFTTFGDGQIKYEYPIIISKK
ncbi:MAG: class I SAM-dependent methyltransferase [Rhodospirillales bacterium]|nr:class I SAM-dependent methyltransferase [Rhodospirillales bacterium]